MNKFRPIIFSVILLSMLLVAQQTLKVGGHTLVSAGIHNSAHGPWFALITYLIWRMISHVTRARFFTVMSSTIVVASIIALLTEFAGVTQGRESSWEDIFRDMCGMVAAIAFIVSSIIKYDKVQSRILKLLGGLLLLFALYPFFMAAAVTLHHQKIQPRLLAFDSYLGYAPLENYGKGQLLTAPDFWPEFSGRRVLKITLTNRRWPGFKLLTPTSDWRSYSFLVIKIYNHAETPLPITVSIRPDSLTGKGTIGFSLRRRLAPGANTVRLAIDELLSHRQQINWQVRMINIYTPRIFIGRSFYLGEIRLE